MLRELAIFLNIPATAITVYPAVVLALSIIKERKVIDTNKKSLNTLLTILSIVFIISFLVSAISSIVSFLGFADIGHKMSPFTRLVLTLGSGINTWLMFLYRNRELNRH